MKARELNNQTNHLNTFLSYEQKFKALADQLRLRIMYELNQHDKICVCDLIEFVNLPQSKLSYHLRILLDANLINKKKIGTWNYYSLNKDEVRNILSEELCCIFYPPKN